jgi:hypothetical protein
MGRRRSYGQGDRGLQNRAALSGRLWFLLTVAVGIPVAIGSYIADHPLDTLKAAVTVGGFIMVFWGIAWLDDRATKAILKKRNKTPRP